MTRDSFPLWFCLLTSSACAGGAPDSATAPLDVIHSVESLDGTAFREPMLVEHPSGAIFVAGYSRSLEEFDDPPNLYVSRDGGAHWEPVDVANIDTPVTGNSDVDLAVAPDGTLYFLTMGFDRSVGEGTHIAVGVSYDIGVSWQWTYLSRTRFDDRPWIVITTDGTAHVIWNDGAGIRYVRSTDRGETWTERARINSRGGSSHFAAGPDGRLAVRIAPQSASGNTYDEGVDLIAVSTDGGDNWTTHTAPGQREWRPPADGPDEEIPRWVEPLAWDSRARLYSMWSEGSELWLGRSSDMGASWDTWTVVVGEEQLYYPYLAASPSGELAASWFSGSGEDLRAHVGLVAPFENSPVVRLSAAFIVDSWTVVDGVRSRDSAGEYFPIIFLSDGDLAFVLPVQASERGDGFTWSRLAR